MHKIQTQELATKISKIINSHKEHFKAYQDNNGEINFNLLIGLILGCICSFSERPAMTINQTLKIFMPVFEMDQLQDYANLMMRLNNYLVDVLESNPNNIYLLENNKWKLICEADFDSVYAIWYAFFGIMKSEFAHNKNAINSLKPNSVTASALEGYDMIHRIMTAPALDLDDIQDMQNKFPEYARRFNELRKLMYRQSIKMH